jgi:hypothetical protein
MMVRLMNGDPPRRPKAAEILHGFRDTRSHFCLNTDTGT